MIVRLLVIDPRPRKGSYSDVLVYQVPEHSREPLAVGMCNTITSLVVISILEVKEELSPMAGRVLKGQTINHLESLLEAFHLPERKLDRLKKLLHQHLDAVLDGLKSDTPSSENDA